MVATDIRKEARESLKNKGKSYTNNSYTIFNNRIINRDRKCTWR